MPVYSPGHNQNWVWGDVLTNGNMAAKSHEYYTELSLGPKSSLFPTRLCTEYD